MQTTGAEAYGKTVWFWHPWLVSNWRRLFEPNRVRPAVNPAAMEAKGIRLQGEHGISRKTTAQGMPGCSGCTCMLVCASYYTLHTRPWVPAGARHSLRPLIFGGPRFKQTSGAARRESADTHSVVIARLDRARPSIPEAAVIEPISRGVRRYVVGR